MSQHDYVLDNGNGLAFREDLNNALAAIVSQNSGATAPATTYAYQMWADTNAGLLKIRNGANNAWVSVCSLADVSKFEIYTNNTKQFDLDSSGNATFAATGFVRLPRGTTAQRPTGATGHIRFNTTLNSFEGYDGSNWGSIGGAGNVKKDTFTGNGSAVDFTLTADPGSANNVFVFIGGVFQQAATYSVSGTTLTFSSAPANLAAIEVRYNVALSIGTPSDNTVSTAKLVDGAVTEAKITLADNTTNNVSSSKHGLTPKTPNDSSKFLDGTGAWSRPAAINLAGVATTSGTAQGFTSIPAGVTEIELMLDAVSETGSTSNLLVQIGDVGGYESSGYVSSATHVGTDNVNRTDGFAIRYSVTSQAMTGFMRLILADAAINRWFATHAVTDAGNDSRVGAGSKTLSDPLDRIRITTQTGNAFDAGTIYMRYRF